MPIVMPIRRALRSTASRSAALARCGRSRLAETAVSSRDVVVSARRSSFGWFLIGLTLYAALLTLVTALSE